MSSKTAEPNLAGMVIERFPYKIVSDSPAPRSKYKKKSFIVYY